MEENNKNILVISVHTWNDEGGSNTLQNLFKQFDPANIYSVYTRADFPKSKFCNNFYQIREISLLRRLFIRKEKVGSVVPSNSAKENVKTLQENKVKKIYKQVSSPLFTFMRELLWLTDYWKEESLKNYIKNSNADTVFILVSSVIYSNRIALYAKELLPKSKVVIYFVDDSYTYAAAAKSFFGIWHRYMLRSTLKKLVQKASDVFVISPKMKREFDRSFSISTKILTKSIDPITIKNSTNNLSNNKIIKLLYVGNLLYGRNTELFNLAQHISEYNTKYGVKFQFDIYTQTTPSTADISKFNKYQNCSLNKPVPYSEVERLQSQYDILIYPESFRARYIRITRLSFSTKATDYLASGKMIWAIGPKHIAPMEYFATNHCALVSTSRATIFKDLGKIANDKVNSEELIKNARKCCMLFHDEEQQGLIFRNAVYN
ncbi:hypothetical protein H1R16_04105 [Marnyiella aurantia]|uniref:Glycosyltransferase family 4 protein n=1 Tax=Marnyiella aurantia TaxID=2758037 RepID=A0A7D7LT58_9FLAO|nr:hypothetical protein [Marnyiella aurantia]MBA5247442.1 hypothetical protein [Marnyiella aurantia]QMS99198.1 hypothetical protein H1R16_04105 [Marnyiella aurantia]